MLRLLTAEIGESPGGISPPGAPRTVREFEALAAPPSRYLEPSWRLFEHA